jgi:hypothetical protein
MITLTYHYAEDWRPLHISEYLKKLREHLGKNLLAYAWVAELQGRGAIHYHIEVLTPVGAKIPLPDSSGMWNHGMSTVATAKRGPWYLCEYLKKEYQKFGEFPKGAHLCGTYIRKDVIGADGWMNFKRWCAPRWVQDRRDRVAGPSESEQTEAVIVRRKNRWMAGNIDLGDSPFFVVMGDAEIERENKIDSKGWACRPGRRWYEDVTFDMNCGARTIVKRQIIGFGFSRLKSWVSEWENLE